MSPPGIETVLRLEGRSTAADLLARESLQIVATDTGIDLSAVSSVLAQTRTSRGAAKAYTLFCNVSAGSIPSEGGHEGETAASWKRVKTCLRDAIVWRCASECGTDDESRFYEYVWQCFGLHSDDDERELRSQLKLSATKNLGKRLQLGRMGDSTGDERPFSEFEFRRPRSVNALASPAAGTVPPTSLFLIGGIRPVKASPRRVVSPPRTQQPALKIAHTMYGTIASKELAARSTVRVTFDANVASIEVGVSSKGGDISTGLGLSSAGLLGDSEVLQTSGVGDTGEDQEIAPLLLPHETCSAGSASSRHSAPPGAPSGIWVMIEVDTGEKHSLVTSHKYGPLPTSSSTQGGRPAQPTPTQDALSGVGQS